MPLITRPLPAVLLFTLLFTTTQLAAAGLELTSGKQQTTLVELYTSQGCSSCPPAERWLSSLQNDPRLWKELIPVAFHVDYWNYLGWNDRLSSPVFSERQRQYHREGAVSAVYTPGIVVNGREWRRWLGVNRLPAAGKAAGQLSVSISNMSVQARYTPLPATTRGLTLNLAILGVGLRSHISHGENAGKTLTQDFAVLHYIRQASSSGTWQLQLPESPPQRGVRLAIAAWIDNGNRQAPLQSVGGWLPHSTTSDSD